MYIFHLSIYSYKIIYQRYTHFGVVRNNSKLCTSIAILYLHAFKKRLKGEIVYIYSHRTSIGADHLKEPHSITSVPCCVSPGTIEIVNSSTGEGSASVFIFAMPRLRDPLYSVPHCPLCLFTIRSTPFVCGTVHNVYVPAGTCMPASFMGADVVNCVAAFAPVRHTRS